MKPFFGWKPRKYTSVQQLTALDKARQQLDRQAAELEKERARRVAAELALQEAQAEKRNKKTLQATGAFGARPLDDDAAARISRKLSPKDLAELERAWADRHATELRKVAREDVSDEVINQLKNANLAPMMADWDKHTAMLKELEAGRRASSIVITPDMIAFRKAQAEVTRLQGALDIAFEDNVALRKKVKGVKMPPAKEEIPGWWQCSPEFVKKAMEDFVPPDGK